MTTTTRVGRWKATSDELSSFEPDLSKSKGEPLEGDEEEEMDGKDFKELQFETTSTKRPLSSTLTTQSHKIATTAKPKKTKTKTGPKAAIPELEENEEEDEEEERKKGEEDGTAEANDSEIKDVTATPPLSTTTSTVAQNTTGVNYKIHFIK